MIPTVIKIIPFALLVAGIAYAKWRLSPPKEVVGSYLPGFDEPHMRRRMIKLEADQDIDLGNVVP